MKFTSTVVLFALLLVVSACSSATKEIVKDAKTGVTLQRESILPRDGELARITTSSPSAPNLPAPDEVATSPQPYGNAAHSPAHGKFSSSIPLKELWSSSIGASASRTMKIMALPVIDDKRLVTLDAVGIVRAFDIKNGDKLWKMDTAPENANGDAMGGGVAIDDNSVFVTNGFGEVIRLNIENGKPIWRVSLGQPLRAAPTIANGNVYVLGLDNQLSALSVLDGKTLWTHRGLSESAALLGAPAPAAQGESVVVAYSSGEVFALRSGNGRVAWTDAVSSGKSASSTIPALAAIRGLPVIDRGHVFITGNAGRTLSIDLRTGDRAWEVQIGGINTPLVSGDAVFLLSNKGVLVALSRSSGRLLWVNELQQRKKPDDKDSDILIWYGPMLAGGKLWIISSEGVLAMLSPDDGKIISTQKIGREVSLPPVFADNRMYLVADDAKIMVFGAK